MENKKGKKMDIFERLRRDAGPLGQYQQIAEGYYIFPNLTGED